MTTSIFPTLHVHVSMLGLGNSIDNYTIMIVVQISWYDSVILTITIVFVYIWTPTNLNALKRWFQTFRIHRRDGQFRPWEWALSMWAARNRGVYHYIGEEHATLSPIEWWQENKVRYPLLAQLASGYLAVPAISVPCERAFSMAGHVVNQNRACLLPSNVNMLVFLAENLDWKLECKHTCTCHLSFFDLLS